MKLLYDENLSHHLVDAVGGLFPGCSHVRSVGLERASDTAIWTYAAEHGYAIVSKDEDFAERALLEGPPPKVIWIRLGNCTTPELAAIFREHRRPLQAFADDDQASLIALA